MYLETGQKTGDLFQKGSNAVKHKDACRTVIKRTLSIGHLIYLDGRAKGF